MEKLYQWVISLGTLSYAPWALFILAFTESSFFLIPPDLLLIPMCIAHPELSFWYALICTVGSVSGGVFGAWIGRKGGRPIAEKFLSEKKLSVAESLYKKYDVWAIGIAGFTPVPYKVFTVLAGILNVKYSVLVIVSIFSRGARFFAVATLIFFFGEQVKIYIEKYFGVLSLALAVLLVGGFAVMKFFKHKSEKEGMIHG